MRCVDKMLVADLAAELGCSRNLAEDLLTLAGEDDDLVKSASSQASRLSHLKAGIIDERFEEIEGMINAEAGFLNERISQLCNRVENLTELFDEKS